MARKKNSRKAHAILDAHPEKAFRFIPSEPNTSRTPCPREDCDGHVIWNGNSTDYYFTCSSRGCDWDTRTDYKSKPKFQLPKPKAKKKPKPFVPDPPEIVEAVRAECNRRQALLVAEAKKFPCPYVEKGKGKNKKFVPNPKFTNDMRKHLHTFAFTSEQVYREIMAKENA
jgi:hypothetical protein